ncbi:glyoxalase [Clostridia bacterium]|nr:glyoxalase [Clostridia bacterium]GHV33352.1 glyoxalase [Clostridia bacterium]
MKYQSTLIVVSDIERSKAFYKKYLGLDVAVDFGANVTLSGGIALKTLETWREFIGGLPVDFKGNAGELYFEEDNFDEFLDNLSGLELVHPPVQHSWGQRVVRFYDPDGHIIEVGENMGAVARRFRENGMTIPEIAVRMDVREDYVREWLSPATPQNKHD